MELVNRDLATLAKDKEWEFLFKFQQTLADLKRQLSNLGSRGHLTDEDGARLMEYLGILRNYFGDLLLEKNRQEREYKHDRKMA